MKFNKSFAVGMMVMPVAMIGLGAVYASSASTPHTFVSGDPALAAEVNQNFANHENAINDNNARLNARDEAPAFHAVISAATASFQSGDTVKCNEQVLDEGRQLFNPPFDQGYHPPTGAYKAPRAGLYLFTFNTNLTSSGVIFLEKNGSAKLASIWEKEPDNNSCSMTVVVRLVKDDTVKPVTGISAISILGTGSEGPYTTFSGHWIRP